ncbi:hypothetical protein [Streptomyces sp. NRRL F-5727]|uniref:hypothetical protein n=1 Tax=Streptomyces sp. NRRL F-5727 TaxID=1463871 RepID=UPI000AE5445B|nr:hypothetical protein [Streptomyces sp. NRRL F-5727]
MTTLYSTPSGVGRHRQTEPGGEESVPQWIPAGTAASGPAPDGSAPAPLPARAPAPEETPAPGPRPAAAPLPVPAPAAPADAPAPTAVVPVPTMVSVPLPAPVPVQVHPDPPIYQALYSLWASQGRTLPGRRDAEWTRLAAGPVWADRTVRVSGILAPWAGAR